MRYFVDALKLVDNKNIHNISKGVTGSVKLDDEDGQSPANLSVVSNDNPGKYIIEEVIPSVHLSLLSLTSIQSVKLETKCHPFKNSINLCSTTVSSLCRNLGL